MCLIKIIMEKVWFLFLFMLDAHLATLSKMVAAILISCTACRQNKQINKQQRADSQSSRWHPWCSITPQKKNHSNDKQVWRRSPPFGSVRASSASFCPWLPSPQTRTQRAQTSAQLLRTSRTSHPLLQSITPGLGQPARHRAALWSLQFPRSRCLCPACSRLLRAAVKNKYII